MKISKNIGTLDRVLRTGVSLIIIYIGFFDNVLIADHVVGIALGLIGIANLIVAIVGYCALYTLINFSTCKKTRDQ